MMYHFEDDLITFYDNGTAVYDDFQLRELYDGNWGVDLEYEYGDEGEEERIYFLDMEFYDPANEDSFGYYAEIRFQTKKTLRISAWNDRGEYKFKLKKQ